MRGLADSRMRLRTIDEIRAIGRAARLAARCLRVAGGAVRPGVATAGLAGAAMEHALSRGAEDVRVFASINEAAAHGEPGDRTLAEGDLVTLDVSLRLDGWYGDVAWSYIAGEGSPGLRALLVAAWWSAWCAVESLQCGGRITAVAQCARDVARVRGFTVVEECSGHGIGRALHEPPTLTYADPRIEGWLVPGMVLTVEPVLTSGDGALRHVGTELVTADGSPAAQFEHTVALLSGGPVVLNWATG